MHRNPYVIKQEAASILLASKNTPSTNATIRTHANTFRKNNLNWEQSSESIPNCYAPMYFDLNRTI